MAASTNPFASLDNFSKQGWTDSEEDDEEFDSDNSGQGVGKKHESSEFPRSLEKIRRQTQNSNNSCSKNKVFKDGHNSSDDDDDDGDYTRTTTPVLRRPQTTWITQQLRLIERDYRIDKSHVLGEPGSFGTAFLCWRHPTSFEQTKEDWKPVYRCVKYINKATLSLLSDFKERERIFKTLAREVGVLKCVDHPNIVQLFDVYENRNEIHLVMEYLPGGELFDRISSNEDGYSEKDAAHIIHQILDALNYLHDRGIMHLDLKPDNILFTDTDSETIKLIDFGVSRVAPRFAKLRAKVGTVPYMAPEGTHAHSLFLIFSVLSFVFFFVFFFCFFFVVFRSIHVCCVLSGLLKLLTNRDFVMFSFVLCCF